MMQKVVSIGNSAGMIIPKELMEKVGLKKGQKLVLTQLPERQAFVVRKAEKVMAPKKQVAGEFDKWLNEVLEEDKEILDELAVR